MAEHDAVLAYLAEHSDAAVERLVEWLAIPSISTDPEYADECRRAGQWLVDDLTSLGFDAGLRETPGHPIVMGHHPGPEGYSGPHMLFYGHYDVQPADPLELWESPPFEPQVVDGPRGQRIIARGAVDDKGQVRSFMEALRAWKETTGTVPCRITVLVEGEEESGSVNLDNFLEAHKNELVGADAPNTPCDLVVVSDTAMWDINTPAITNAVRGLVYTEVILHGPSRDLHSGLYGGAVINPINELVRILGRLHDGDQRVTLPGFYDDVDALSDDEKRDWASLNFDEKGFLGEIGYDKPYGEKGFNTLERRWARPTCDINGIKGGYIGEGAKTVIATHASAKVSFRLVPHQDPKKIEAAFKAWIESQAPEGCRVEFLQHGTGRPCVTPTDRWFMPLAKECLEMASNKKAVTIRSGGSIPVVESFDSILGLDTLLLGFGLSDDRVHSPNEKFERGCFEIGQRSHAMFMGRLGSATRPS